MSYEAYDKHGRLVETEERSFRPLDGKDISEQSKQALKDDIEAENFQKALKDIYHILTGEKI